jgi:hypothetical protein
VLRTISCIFVQSCMFLHVCESNERRHSSRHVVSTTLIGSNDRYTTIVLILGGKPAHSSGGCGVACGPRAAEPPASTFENCTRRPWRTFRRLRGAFEAENGMLLEQFSTNPTLYYLELRLLKLTGRREALNRHQQRESSPGCEGRCWASGLTKRCTIAHTRVCAQTCAMHKCAQT